jgi:hypothetical protein
MLARYFQTFSFRKYNQGHLDNEKEIALEETGKAETVEPAGGKAVHPQVIPVQPVVKEKRRGETAQELAGEIKALLIKAGKAKTERGELIYELQQLLGKEPYISFRGTPFQEPIMNQVRKEAEEYCSIQFDAEELAGMWIR